MRGPLGQPGIGGEEGFPRGDKRIPCLRSVFLDAAVPLHGPQSPFPFRPLEQIAGLAIFTFALVFLDLLILVFSSLVVLFLL